MFLISWVQFCVCAILRFATKKKAYCQKKLSNIKYLSSKRDLDLNFFEFEILIRYDWEWMPETDWWHKNLNMP